VIRVEACNEAMVEAILGSITAPALPQEVVAQHLRDAYGLPAPGNSWAANASRTFA
jgi:hypothetical protein